MVKGGGQGGRAGEGCGDSSCPRPSSSWLAASSPRGHLGLRHVGGWADLPLPTSLAFLTPLGRGVPWRGQGTGGGMKHG